RDRNVTGVQTCALPIYLTGSYGRNVRIIGDGWHTIYAHLQRIVGKDGRKVKAGTQIGTVDSTGNSTGNHLHFEAGSGIGSTANRSVERRGGEEARWRRR